MTFVNTFTFNFDDLPLVIENGFEACEVSGSAEIEYSRDGEWSIASIYFEDGRKRIKYSTDDYLAAAATGKFSPVYERKAVALDRGTPIYSIIYDRLDNEWCEQVQEAVRNQLASDREDALEARADARRDARMGL
jgi:hypothetical protein